MTKKVVRLTESDLNRIIRKSVNKILKEDFNDEFNKAREQYKRPMFGFELKNQEGEWEYGDVTYDPQTQTMSCMGVSIKVDPSMSVDANLEGLYEELLNQGYHEEE